MPTYADLSGWVISIIAGRFEVIADRFDFESVFHNIDGESIEAQLSFSDAAAAWAIMLDWMCKGPGRGGRGPHVLTIAIKALGLQLWLSPEACAYSSMEEVAEALGCTKQPSRNT
jgi:hypothetical protein